MLLEAGIIDAAQLQAALGHQRRWGGRLGQALVDLKITSEVQIVDALSRKLGYDPIRLAAVEYGPSLELALRLVPHEFAQRNVLLPYAADMGTIWVAMADPTNVALVDEIAFRTGRKVKVSLAGDREIADAVRRLYLMEKRGMDAIPIDEVDDEPVEMAGSFGGGTSQALDAFFQRTPSPPASGGSHVEVVPIAVAPADSAAPPRNAPPPLPAAAPAPPAGPGTPAAPAAPGRSGQGIPPAGAAARLAEAVRGLRLEDETTAARPVPGGAPSPAAPGAARVPPDGNAASPARAPAPVAGGPPPPPAAAQVWVPTPLPEGADGSRTIELPLSAVTPLDEPRGSPRLHALLDALDRASRGDASAPETARLARAVAALVRVLVAKGVVEEEELLAAFLRK
jgi:type IV pilus assembly protein PilB